MTEPTDANEEIILPEKLDLAASETLRSQLLERVESDVTLDASQVHFLGGAGLELLLSAQAEWSRREQAFDIIDPSAGFLADIADLGVDATTLTEESVQ